MSSAQEIEVKYRVRDFDGLLLALHQRGIALSTAVHQDDQAYAPVGWQYGMSKVGTSFARLRTQDGRHLFTLKRPVENEQSCLEFESEVADREQMHQAIMQMGFYPTVRIVKARRGARYRDLSLCLDDVDHAGTFLEIEKVIGPSESGLAVQAELDGFARSFGVALDRTDDTYDSLVRAELSNVYNMTARPYTSANQPGVSSPVSLRLARPGRPDCRP
ncbi:adenylate cyclase class 2 [Krasilnikovia cinnamomea]|uniref:Adenylate cyclase class 2 n=1 Tax=Krasilnikovia cinnamomea TaxID=349313 RepID=A0A4Q7ZST0_9ACTN|nr:CYTH domain-containing protein [Krasilnikovia cinnamomea]RZU53881.1 adenylate cyclase class 2 [Krasilnikovia cinnamomea]